MPYVVTQSCCSDASCVFACPVNCIHPTPDEPDFASAEMLHVDPATCVDCGACASACPVDAIGPVDRLTPEQQPFIEINADFYRQSRPRPLLAPPIPAPALQVGSGPLRVAIVGSGPAAMYAADEVLTASNTEVTVLERLPQPYGLARYGVAPDHRKTRKITELFDAMSAQEGFTGYCGVEIGRDISHAELLAHHHAVIYAVGAARDRRLEVPGADIPGTISATDFVAWYNGHPDQAERQVDLSHRRVVIVGNGNVALDIARILTTDPEKLAGTDISPRAWETLRGSAVREVVIVARRGPAESAFTVPEFLGLLSSEVEIAVEGDIPNPADAQSLAVEQKLRLLREIAGRPTGRPRRIVLRYLTAPEEVLGTEGVTGLRVRRTRLVSDSEGRVTAIGTAETEDLEAGMVCSAVGYRGTPLPDLPFDEAKGIVPNDRGRVLGAPGVYVAGWIKRGPTGFLGTNKSCATQTVHQLAADVTDGRLPELTGNSRQFARLLRQRCPGAWKFAGPEGEGPAPRNLLQRLAIAKPSS